jgi:erythromycin esterase
MPPLRTLSPLAGRGTGAKRQGEGRHSAGTCFSRSSSPPPSGTAPWCRRAIRRPRRGCRIALRTTEAASDDSDLAPLLPLAGNARVVALGDATHGTHELFTLHNRLAKFLIEHAGFRTVALEGPYDLEKLDAYVKAGEGDPAAALQVEAYFFWHVEEALELVQWIRAWNAAGNPTVSIASIDAVIPNAATAAVVGYLRGADPAAADRAAARYACLDDYWTRSSYIYLPAEYHAQCRDGVLAVRADVEAHRDESETFERALHAARVAEQAVEDFDTERLSRDRHLAENILWNAARAKTIVIGHMVHFGRIDYDFNGPVIVSAGEILAKELGSDYVTVASATYSGRVTILLPTGPSIVDIVPPPAADVTQTLARGAMPMMIVPLRNAPRWLSGKQQWRIAATNANFAARPTFTINGDLVAGWDALIYVESTSATRLLP